MASTWLARLAGEPTSAQVVELLVELTVKSTLLLALAVVAVLAMRRVSAASRHWVWSAAMIALLALPGLVILLPTWGVPLLPAADNGASVVAVAGETAGIASSVTEVDAEVGGEAGSAASFTDEPTADRLFTAGPGAAAAVHDPGPGTGRPLDPHRLALMVWALGVLGVGVWLLVGHWGVSRTIGRSAPVTDSAWTDLSRHLSRSMALGRPVPLLCCEDALTPMTSGVLRPVVILPARAAAWTPERRRSVLLHELAHVRRRDCLTQLRRDVRGPSDQILVFIDSYDDRRTGFQFIVNPDGVKRDFAMFNDGQEDVSWSGVWEVATHVDSLGWRAVPRPVFAAPVRGCPEPYVRLRGLARHRAVSRANRVACLRPDPNGARLAARRADRNNRDRVRPSTRNHAVPGLERSQHAVRQRVRTGEVRIRRSRRQVRHHAEHPSGSVCQP